VSGPEFEAPGNSVDWKQNSPQRVQGMPDLRCGPVLDSEFLVATRDDYFFAVF
jgi:hypothetical protein